MQTNTTSIGHHQNLSNEIFYQLKINKQASSKI